MESPVRPLRQVLKTGDKLVTLSLTSEQIAPSSESKLVFENAAIKVNDRRRSSKLAHGTYVSQKKSIIVVALESQVCFLSHLF